MYKEENVYIQEGQTYKLLLFGQNNVLNHAHLGGSSFNGEFYDKKWLRPVTIGIENLGTNSFKIKEFTILDPKENESNLKSEMESLQKLNEKLESNEIELNKQQLLIINQTLELNETNLQIQFMENELINLKNEKSQLLIPKVSFSETQRVYTLINDSRSIKPGLKYEIPEFAKAQKKFGPNIQIYFELELQVKSFQNCNIACKNYNYFTFACFIAKHTLRFTVSI